MGCLYRSIPFFFALILALSSHQFFVDAHVDLITQVCGQIPLKKAECISTFELFPELVIATDAQSLIKIALKHAIANAGEIKNDISLLSKKSADAYERECLKTCSHVYQDAIVDIQETLSVFHSKSSDFFYYNQANIKISGAMTYAQTCDEGFEARQNGKSPLANMRAGFDKLCSIALHLLNDLAEKKSPGAPPPSTGKLFKFGL